MKTDSVPVAADLDRHLVDLFAGQASALLVREPLVDPFCPTTFDLDVLAFGEVEELLPERRWIPGPKSAHPPIDVVWLPRKLLDRPDYLAAQGLLPHRLLSSRVLYDSGGWATPRIERVRQLMYAPAVQPQRISGLLDLGADTVREIGVTRDFPELALFWLHVAAAALIAALSDAAGFLRPNVYTRPLDHIDKLESFFGIDLFAALGKALFLDVKADALIAPLRRVHKVVATRFPEPVWPDNMRQCTRYEYRYFNSRDELEWRIRVAGELSNSGRSRAAIYYLRFWAYMLACIPMVFQRAREGIDVSFVRPQRAVKPDLELHCPEILADLGLVWGAEGGGDLAFLEKSLGRIHQLRETVTGLLAQQGIELQGARPWLPYKPPLATEKTDVNLN